MNKATTELCGLSTRGKWYFKTGRIIAKLKCHSKTSPVSLARFDCSLQIAPISNISRIKSQNLNVSHFVLQLSLLNPLKSGDEDAVGAAPTGDAPITSE